jgi:hypothetical protein
VALGVADAVLTLSVVFIAWRVQDLCPCCAGPVVMAVYVADVDDNATPHSASPARGYQAVAFILSV